MQRSLILAALSVAAFAGAEADAQVLGPNLLQNPHFDADLSSWLFDNSDWFAADANDLPSSGSVLLVAPPISVADISQCVGGVAAGRYHFGAKFRTGVGWATSPLVLTFYSGPDCAGSSVGSEYVGPAFPYPPPWQAAGKTVEAPPGTGSAKVSANIACGMAHLCSGVSMAFDDVFLRAEAPALPADFYTLTPCRVADTRSGTAVKGFRQLTVSTLGCGVPPTARALSLNVTVTGASAAGNLRLYAADSDVPSTSVANFAAGQARANNATVAVSVGAALEMYAVIATAGASVHVILDVNGYYQ